MAKRHGGEKRGNNADRAARRLWLARTYGDGTSCPCFNCKRTLLVSITDIKVPGCLTVDRIIPGEQGGTYRRENIRPACITCNNGRRTEEATAVTPAPVKVTTKSIAPHNPRVPARVIRPGRPGRV